MGVAGGEIAIWRRKVRVLMDCEKELRHCLIEAPTEEMRRTGLVGRTTDIIGGDSRLHRHGALHGIDLWRPALVVHLPEDRSPHGEAIPAEWRVAFLESAGLSARIC